MLLATLKHGPASSCIFKESTLQKPHNEFISAPTQVLRAELVLARLRTVLHGRAEPSSAFKINRVLNLNVTG